jgi:hypothetical protein
MILDSLAKRCARRLVHEDWRVNTGARRLAGQQKLRRLVPVEGMRQLKKFNELRLPTRRRPFIELQ